MLGKVLSSVAVSLRRPGFLGVFGAVPIVGGVLLLLGRAALLQVDVLRPPFAGILIASLIAWPLLALVCAACDAMVRPATFKLSLRRGGIIGAVAATVGWIAVVALIEGLFKIDESGVHRSMGDPEELVRFAAPYLLPVVAFLGFLMGGFAAVATWSGRKVWRAAGGEPRLDERPVPRQE